MLQYLYTDQPLNWLGSIWLCKPNIYFSDKQIVGQGVVALFDVPNSNRFNILQNLHIDILQNLHTDILQNLHTDILC